MFISHYTHEASPGYYKACLTDNGATVEVTTSPYVAMYRVRYDDASSRKVYFNFQNYTTRHFPKELPVRNHNEVEFPDDNTITGRCGGGEYFVVKFDSPVVSVDEVQVDTMYSGPQYVVDFGPGKKEVGIKVSFSLVDREGAAVNVAMLAGHGFARFAIGHGDRYTHLLDAISSSAPGICLNLILSVLIN
jgi:putative alpha-1,2-mannosidase